MEEEAAPATQRLPLPPHNTTQLQTLTSSKGLKVTPVTTSCFSLAARTTRRNLRGVDGLMQGVARRALGPAIATCCMLLCVQTSTGEAAGAVFKRSGADQVSATVISVVAAHCGAKENPDAERAAACGAHSAAHPLIVFCSHQCLAP